MSSGRTGWQANSSAKNGQHNLGGNIKNHSAACFHNGGVVGLADGGMTDPFKSSDSGGAEMVSKMRDDYEAKKRDYRMDEPAEAPMKTTEESAPSPSSTPSPQTSPGQADQDLAGAQAGAKQAAADEYDKRKEFIQQASANLGGWGGQRRAAKQAQATQSKKAENDKLEASVNARPSDTSRDSEVKPSAAAGAGSAASKTDTGPKVIPDYEDSLMGRGHAAVKKGWKFLEKLGSKD
jgi:hypothetical protein